MTYWKCLMTRCGKIEAYDCTVWVTKQIVLNSYWKTHLTILTKLLANITGQFVKLESWNFSRFEASRVLLVRRLVFWDGPSCSGINRSQYFKQTQCLDFQDLSNPVSYMFQNSSTHEEEGTAFLQNGRTLTPLCCTMSHRTIILIKFLIHISKRFQI
jgi:hypothetical protein